jgi:HK97 gp10 family phage protein
MVTVKVKGLNELQARLAELPRRLSRQVLEKGLTTGAQPMAAEAQARVPVLAVATPRRRPGTVKKRIQARRVRPRSGMAATVIVGVRGLSAGVVRNYKLRKAGRVVSKRGGADFMRGLSAADNPNDPFYWKFLEFGTSKMPARPFLRPAFEAQKGNAVTLAAEEWKKVILQAASELNRPVL